jgi:hypothetical protein
VVFISVNTKKSKISNEWETKNTEQIAEQWNTGKKEKKMEEKGGGSGKWSLYLLIIDMLLYLFIIILKIWG